MKFFSLFLSHGCILLLPLSLVYGQSAPANLIDRARQAIAGLAEANQEMPEVLGTEEAAGEADPVPPAPVLPARTPPAPVYTNGNGSGGEPLFSVDYTEAPIRRVLREIAELAELNVIIPDQLTGSVTVRLQDVAWQTLFDIILEETGFTWDRGETGIIRIGRLSADRMVERLDSGNITVNFISEDIREAVRAIGDAAGVNVVIPVELAGTTSARLTDISWQRALSTILEERSFQWYEDDGIIRLRAVDSRVVVNEQTGQITVRIVNTPFGEVVSLLGRSQTPPVNVVSAPAVRDIPISIEVSGVDFDQAITIAISQIPRPQDPAAPRLFYVARLESPTLLRIIDSDELAAIEALPPVVRIFSLRYAQTMQVLDLLLPYRDLQAVAARNFFRQASELTVPIIAGIRSIAADEANNTLIITANPTSLPAIASLIESLDQPIQQVMIETRFVEVSDVDERNLGVNWSTLRNFSIGTSEDGLTREYERSSITTREGEREIIDGDNFLRTQRNLDTRTRESSSNQSRGQSGTSTVAGSTATNITTNPPAANITINDSNSSSRSNTFGSASAAAGSSDFLFEDEALSTRTISNTLTQTLNSIVTTGRTDTAIFGTSAFAVVLSALREDTNAKLTSNPTIVTMNGQEARINIQENLYRQGPPVTGETGPAQPGGPILLEVQPQTSLFVKPTITGGNMIALNIRPEINNQVGIQEVSGTIIPRIRQRTTESTVLLRSGYTLAIGGLMDEDEFEAVTKVPLLGDIPVVGRLFRHERILNQTRNQIIFITASLLNAQVDTFEDVIGVDRLNRMGLSDRDVMGVGARAMSPEEEELERAIRILRNRLAERQRIESVQRNVDTLQALEDAAENTADDEESAGPSTLRRGARR